MILYHLKKGNIVSQVTNVSTRIIFSRNKDFMPKVFKTIHKKKKTTSGKYCKTTTTTTTSKSMALCDSQISMSADASFPLVPKWILMNFPCNTHTHTHTTTWRATASPAWTLPSSPAPFCTHEARRVVVADGFGVAERLHGWIGFDDLVLQRALNPKKI